MHVYFKFVRPHNNFYVANKMQLLKLQQQTTKRMKLGLNHRNGRTFYSYLRKLQREKLHDLCGSPNSRAITRDGRRCSPH